MFSTEPFIGTFFQPPAPLFRHNAPFRASALIWGGLSCHRLYPNLFPTCALLFPDLSRIVPYSSLTCQRLVSGSSLAHPLLDLAYSPTCTLYLSIFCTHLYLTCPQIFTLLPNKMVSMVSFIFPSLPVKERERFKVKKKRQLIKNMEVS